MTPISVENYNDVVESVRAFNKGLEEDESLGKQLSYFRAWYYIPELDAVGPSKFIGYKSLSVAAYLTHDGLDGKVSEPILGRWFSVLINNTPEAKYVESLVERLLARYNKVMNRKARFNAPRGWNLEKVTMPSLNSAIQVNPQTDNSSPIAEVFWLAYLSLSKEDQDTIWKRIIARRKHISNEKAKVVIDHGKFLPGNKKEILKGEKILDGCGASSGIVVGLVRNIFKQDPKLALYLRPGEILVAEGPAIHSAVPEGVGNEFYRRPLAIVTDKGGRTCSVGIISRELDIPAVTGTGEATKLLETGQIVVVDGDEGAVYYAANDTNK